VAALAFADRAGAGPRQQKARCCQHRASV